MSLAEECNEATNSIKIHLSNIGTLLQRSLDVMKQAEEGLPEAVMEDLPGYAIEIGVAARGVVEHAIYISGLHKGTWLEKKRWDEQHKAKNNG